MYSDFPIHHYNTSADTKVSALQ